MVKKWGRVIENYAKMAGITTDELIGRYQVNVARDGLKPIVDVSNYAPALKELRAGPKQGKSLLQFIRSLGGIKDSPEMVDMEKGLKGRKISNKSAKYGPDLIARSAMEAGYLQDEDPNSLYEAIRKEISGSPVYGREDEPSDEVNSLKQIIDALKLNLDAMSDEEILREVALGQAQQREEEFTLFQMAGRKSKTANTGKLSQAFKMHESGTDMETIRKETGWFMAPDKRWRYEISDENAKFKDINLNKKKKYSLDQVIEHKDLFDAYPQLKEIEIQFGPHRGRKGGHFNLEDKKIKVNVPLDTVLGIKGKEAAKRIAEIAKTEEYKNYRKAYDTDIEKVGDIESRQKARDAYRDSGLMGEMMGLSMLVNKDFKKQYPEKLQDHSMSILLHEIQHAIQDIEGFAPGANSRVDGKFGYRNSLGEIEARNTEVRMNLNEEQRYSLSPDTQTWKNPVIKWNKVIAELPLEDVPDQMLEKFIMGAQTTLFQSKDTDQKRGSIDIIRDGLGRSEIFNIKFLENANRTTFIHESAHAFLEIIADLAEDPSATQAVKDEYSKILKYLGVKQSQDPKNRTKFNRRAHEKFAESIEKYFMEGKAPAPELTGLYATFKSWMIAAYKTIEQMYPNVKLNDEIRGVFDRMFATEDELDRARAQTGSVPQFKNTEGVMTPAEAKKYQELIEKEREKQTAIVMDQAMRSQTKEYLLRKKEREAELRDVVREEVSQEPKQVALKAIREGVLPNGQTLPGGMETLKIDRKEARRIYAEEVLDRLPRGVLTQDGLHPNIVANLLYGSEMNGAELVLQLSETPEFKDRVEEVVKQRMDEEFTDPTTDGTIQKAALDAVHNDIALNRKQFEIDVMMQNQTQATKGMIKRITARKITNAQFKARAKIIIGATAIRDIKPNTYRRAELSNSKKAVDLFLKGDTQRAIEAKQAEILAGELYKLAIKIDREVDDSIDEFKKAFRPDDAFSKRYNMDTFKAAQSLLSYYGFGKVDKSPEEYLKYIESYNKDIYNSVSQYLAKAILNAKDYRDLTYNEFVDLDNSFEQIKEIAKLENQITVQGKKANKRQAIDNELIPQLKDVQGDRPDKALRPSNKGNLIERSIEKSSFLIGSFKNSLRRAEAWVYAMDAGKWDGPFRKYIFDPVYNGVIKYRINKAVTLGKFRDLIKASEGLFNEEQIVAPELQSIDDPAQSHTFNGTRELLGALLHTGNKSNLRKLLVGNGWGSLDDDGNLDSSSWDAFKNRMIREGKLTKAHFDLVQELWDLMEEIKPGAQEAHRSLYGFYFNEVTAEPFETPWGTYKGGYTPAIIDKTVVKNVSEYSVEIDDTAYNWWPSNPNGFTKARVENYNQPLMMDIRLIPNHVDAVLRFSHISVPVKEVMSLLKDKSMAAALNAYDPTLIEDFIQPWIERVLSQRSTKSTDNRGLDYILTKMRSLQGAGVMFANVINTMQQYTGILVATSKVGVKYLRNSTFDVIKSGKKVSEFAVSKSDFMKTKITFANDNMIQEVQSIIEKPNDLERVDQWFKKNAYILQGIAQGQVDLIVWTGAYNEAIDQGASDKVAVQQADSAVRLTQGTFAAEDISSIEAGNPVLKLFTMFYSYYNTIANLYASEMSAAMNQDLGLRKTAGRAFFLYAMAFAIPSVLAQAMTMALSGQPFDENDDDDYIEDALKLFFMPQVRTVTGMIPGLGPMINAAIAKFDSNAMNDRISFSPVFQTLEKFTTKPYDLYHAYEQGTVNKKVVQDSLSLMTLLNVVPGVPFIPFQALSRPVGYLMDVNSGRANPDNPVDVIQGILSGRQAKK